MKSSCEQTARRTKREEGSAFVISILILFVLTVLGLALMLSTSTEKDISVNYRWGEQAFFNADAGLEYGKNVLAVYALNVGNFQTVLPVPRATVQVANANVASNPGPMLQGADCANPATAGCRDYQYWIDQCPAGPYGTTGPCTRVYIGRVLRRFATGTPVMYDFRTGGLGNDFTAEDGIDPIGTPDIQGSVTLWVRRPIVGTADYGFTDNRHDRVILTAEGTAPGGGLGGRPTSVRRLEMSVRLPSAGVGGDEYGGTGGRGGAAGGGRFDGGGTSTGAVNPGVIP